MANMTRDGCGRGSSLSTGRLSGVPAHAEADLVGCELIARALPASAGRRRSRRCGWRWRTARRGPGRSTSTAVPARARDSSNRWMPAAAPASTPQVGCAAISTDGACSISRPITNFCRLPPERLRAALSTLRVRTPKSATTLAGKALRLAIVEEAQPAQPHAGRGGERRVLPQRHVGHRGMPQPLLGDEAHPQRAPSRGAAGADRDAVDSDRVAPCS